MPTDSFGAFDPRGYLRDFLRPRVSHISRHVGKDPSSLIDRICAEPGCKKASSFAPSMDVPLLVRNSLKLNWDHIRAAFSTRGRDRHEYQVDQQGCGLSILWDGYGLVARKSDRFKVVLAKDPSMRYGFFIMTAYPTFSMEDPAAPVDLERALLGSAAFMAPATAPAEALKKGAMRASAYLGEDIPVVSTGNTVQALIPVSDRALPEVSVATRIDHGRITATQFTAVRRGPDGSCMICGIPEGTVGMSAAECLRRVLERDAGLKERIHRATDLVKYPKARTKTAGTVPTERPRGPRRGMRHTPPPPEPPSRARDDGFELG